MISRIRPITLGQKVLSKSRVLATHTRLHYPDDGKSLYIDLRSNVRLRLIETLAIPFLQAGYQPVLPARLDRKTVNRTSLPLIHCPVTFSVMPPLPSPWTVYCTDDETALPQDGHFKKLVLLDYQRSAHIDPDGFDVWFPLMMHPALYLRGGHDVPDGADEARDRPVRILFGGRYGPGYDWPGIHDVYGVPNRNEVVAELTALPSTVHVRSDEEWEKALKLQDEPSVIFDDGYRVWQNRWLWSLSQAEFFLCAPGLLYPPSHNAFEAITAGSVPIISYPEWFVPALRHGENCLVYRSVEQLRDVLATAYRMERSEIARMRRNIAEYRERYVSPRSVVERILNSDREVVRTRILEAGQLMGALQIPD